MGYTKMSNSQNEPKWTKASLTSQNEVILATTSYSDLRPYHIHNWAALYKPVINRKDNNWAC